MGEHKPKRVRCKKCGGYAIDERGCFCKTPRGPMKVSLPRPIKSHPPTTTERGE